METTTPALVHAVLANPGEKPFYLFGKPGAEEASLHVLAACQWTGDAQRTQTVAGRFCRQPGKISCSADWIP